MLEQALKNSSPQENDKTYDLDPLLDISTRTRHLDSNVRVQPGYGALLKLSEGNVSQQSWIKALNAPNL